MPDGAAWQPLGASARRGRARDGQRGQRGRWEERQGDAWSKIRRAQSCRCLGTAGGRSHARAQRSRGDRGLGEDDEGPGCKKQKTQGPHCKAWTTFAPMLKWRWTQKQKCRVFQEPQLCFKVHLQKSNSFETSVKLSIIFKLYVNPIDKTTLHIHPKGSFTYFCNLNTNFELLQNNPHTFEFYPLYSPT
jgi:hypothetical protein